MWRHVNGPATALVATCKRVGWSSEDGRRFLDDLGQQHDVALDSPIAVAAAATRSVKRWCLKQTITELPTAAPPNAAARATPADGSAPSRALIDITPALKPLYKHTRSAVKKHPNWQPKHLPHLKSAINGGQWPQARKANLPGWQHGDQCQLCNAATGTADHRHVCPVTCPPEGWPEPPSDAKQFIDKLSTSRQRALKNRAVLAVDISLPAPQLEHHNWQWCLVPDDIQDPTLRWYIDGSRKFPRHYELATTGCGLAVVDSDGALVGCANATPPRWCDSSAAAETWALHLTLKELIGVPQIFTDCQGLLRTANSGFTAATSPKKATARIWRLIEDTLDSRMQPLREALVWIPAHTSIDVCCTRQRSDSKPMTPVDWRANQLADVLAKAAAPEDAGRRVAKRYIEAAQSALVHSAVRLGMVTHAANCCPEQVQSTGGTVSVVMRRDSTSWPTHAKSTEPKRKFAKLLKDKPAPPVCSASWVGSAPQQICAPLSRLQHKKAAARGHCARRKRAANEELAAAVSSAASRLSLPTGQLPAVDRMHALRERIRQRSSASASA